MSPPTVSLADRIQGLEHELAALRQQQQADLVATIVTVIGGHVVFSARELWQHQVVHPELRDAFRDAGIASPKQLGKRLRQCCGCGLERIGADRAGAIWTVIV